jgi:hypothetical protein
VLIHCMFANACLLLLQAGIRIKFTCGARGVVVLHLVLRASPRRPAERGIARAIARTEVLTWWAQHLERRGRAGGATMAS